MKTVTTLLVSLMLLCGTAHAQMANDALTELINEREAGYLLRDDVARLYGSLFASLSGSRVKLRDLEVLVASMPATDLRKRAGELNVERIKVLIGDAETVLCDADAQRSDSDGWWDDSDIVTSGKPLGECLYCAVRANAGYRSIIDVLRNWEAHIIQLIPGRIAATTAYLED